MKVMFHDDGCDVRLVDGYCPVCKFAVDTQSTMLAEQCPHMNGSQCIRPARHRGDHLVITAGGAHAKTKLNRQEEAAAEEHRPPRDVHHSQGVEVSEVLAAATVEVPPRHLMTSKYHAGPPPDGKSVDENLTRLILDDPHDPRPPADKEAAKRWFTETFICGERVATSPTFPPESYPPCTLPKGHPGAHSSAVVAMGQVRIPVCMVLLPGSRDVRCDQPAGHPGQHKGEQKDGEHVLWDHYSGERQAFFPPAVKAALARPVEVPPGSSLHVDTVASIRGTPPLRPSWGPSVLDPNAPTDGRPSPHQLWRQAQAEMPRDVPESAAQRRYVELMMEHRWIFDLRPVDHSLREAWAGVSGALQPPLAEVDTDKLFVAVSALYAACAAALEKLK